MTIVGIRKCLVFSIRSTWRSICRHPFVAALLLFMLFLYVYFPSIFAFIVYSSPVIACTALLLGALLVYGEPDIRENEAVKSVNFSVKAAEKDERSRDFTVLKKDERNISEENINTRGGMSLTKVGPFDGDGHGKDGMDLAANSSSKIAEKEIQTEKTVTNEEESGDLEFIEKQVFSIENPADHALRIAEGLKVEIEMPLDGQFDSSLGSPWQKVNSNEVSSDSESESDESEGEQSLSPDTSMTDIVPIIDELHPLLESENPLPVHGSIYTSDAASRASSPEHEFDDGSAEEETENRADEEDEEAQEENDNDEAVVKWTADDQKNLMDLGSSELERNQRLENLIAKRKAKKLQRFQTDKNLIDLDTEPLPFLEDITRLNVQVPPISAARSNPFDLPFDSEDNFGLLPIPVSAPSVLLPRRNPFELPYDQNEESSKLTGESSRPYDASISQRDPPPRRIDGLNLGVVSDDANQGKNEHQLKPYFVPEKMSESSFASFEGQLSEESDSEESSASASDSTSAVFNQDHELLKHETHERVSSVHEDVRSFDQESDLSVEVGSANLEQEHDVADAVEEVEIGEVDSSSPVSGGANLEVIDERYDGSSSSSCSEEDDKCIERSDHIERINSAHTMGVLSILKPGLLDKGAEDPHDSQAAEPSLSAKRVEGADDSQVADPVYDSSPSAKSASHIPSLEALFSNNVKGKEGFQEVFSTSKAFEQGATSGAGDFKFDRKNMPPVPHDYIERVEGDPGNVVEKVKGPNEVNANLREIKSVNESSDLGINIGEKFLVEDLISDAEIQELQPKPSKQLDSNMMVDPCTEKEDAPNQFRFPLLRSDDAGVSVNQHSNLNSSHDQHSAMEQPSALESDAGSSAPFDGNLEMKDAKLHISEPFVVDSNETVSSSTSELTVDNSEAPENFPKPLNSNDKHGHSEYDVKEKQSDAD